MRLPSFRLRLDMFVVAALSVGIENGAVGDDEGRNGSVTKESDRGQVLVCPQIKISF